MRRRASIRSGIRSFRLGRRPITLEIEPLEDRLMLDVGASSASPSTPPPLVVGRTLSSPTVGGIQNNQETITYTVYNETPDPITGLTLKTTLQPGVTPTTTAPPATGTGNALSWDLGAVGGFSEATVQVTVSLASPAPAALDFGASAAGTADVGGVTATTTPASLRAGTVDPTLLAATPDANSNDPYIQEKAAELGYDPAKIFAFVRDQVGYNAYTGSLRGARGTLWSAAGNALDKASLAIALLRASGIPAQYAEGTLPTDLAQQMILSMFPPTTQVVGCVGPNAQTADPANDPTLLDQTTDHAWVQFDTGGGMQDADPNFPAATVGKSFTTATTTFAVVPADQRYTVDFQVSRELTSPSLFGTTQDTKTVLDQTFNTVDLVGKVVAFGNFVSSSSAGFLITSTTNNYSPYLAVGDEGGDLSQIHLYRGEDYQEVLTNFPFGTQVLTGLFLNMNVSGPDGPTETYSRTLVDRLGFDVRQNGGTPPAISASGPPIISPTDIWTLSVLPGLQNGNPSVPLDAQVGQLQDRINALTAAGQATPELTNDLREFTIGLAEEELINFLTTSDTATQQLAARSLVDAYYDRPRITLLSTRGVPSADGKTATTSFALDLRADHIRAVAFPGQNLTVSIPFQTAYGFQESGLESQIIALLDPTTGPQYESTSTVTVFQAAAAQHIGTVMISSANLSVLDTLAISAQAKARITQAVGEGKEVVVPRSSVDVNGTKTVAWYETDPNTGETIGVTEDGGHQASIGFAALLTITTLLTLVLPVGIGVTAAADALRRLRMCPPAQRRQCIQAIIKELDQKHDLFLALVAFFAVVELNNDIPGLVDKAQGGNGNPSPQLTPTAMDMTMPAAGAADPAATTTAATPTPLGDILLAPGPLGAFGALAGTGVAAGIVPDPGYSEPFNGAQLPTVFRIGIKNTGTAADTFRLDAASVPQGFELMTSLPQVAIAPGQTVEIGVCLMPTGKIGAPGSDASFSIQVTSTTTSTVTATAKETFTLPEIHGLTLAAAPGTVSTTPGTAVSDTLTITDVGNVPETNVTLAADLPPGLMLGGLAPVSLDVGQAITETLTLTPDASTPLNSTLEAAITATFGAAAIPQMQSLRLPLLVVVPGAAALASAADVARQAGNSGLADRLRDLANALTNLVQNPTNAAYKGQAAANIDSLVSQLDHDTFLAGFAPALDTAKAAINAAASAADVQAAASDLGKALASLSQGIADEAAHGLSLSLVPDRGVLLADQTTQFDIVLKNDGSQATTYDLSVSGLPPDVTFDFARTSVTLQPGQALVAGQDAISLKLSETGETLVPADFSVIATAEGAPEITASTPGALTLRGEALFVSDVSTTPPFTAPGGMVDVSTKVQANVNEPRSLNASYTVADSSGKIVFTSAPVPVTLDADSELTTLDLGSFSTAGLANGHYAVTVTLADTAAQPLAPATGRGDVTVGLPVNATLTTTPSTLPTGDPAATNTLTVTTQASYPSPLTLLGSVATPNPSTSVALAGKYAYESGTGGVNVIDVSDPANPKRINTFGSGDLSQGTFGFNVVKIVAGRLVVATQTTLNSNQFNLLVYSLADPVNPALLSNTVVNYRFLADLLVNSTSTAAYVPTNGDFFYGGGDIFDQFGSFLGISLADPTKPTLASALFNNRGTPDGGDTWQPGGVLVNDQIAYVASTTSTGSDVDGGVGRVLVVNVADPAKMSLTKELDIPGTERLITVAVHGNRALVVGSSGGLIQNFGDLSKAGFLGNVTLTVLDVTDPNNPQILSTLVTPETFPRGEVGGKTDARDLGNGLFAVSDASLNGTPVILLVDPSDPADPVIAAPAVPAAIHGITVSGDTLYATTSAGLSIYHIGQLVSDPVTVSVQVPTANDAVVASSFNAPPTQTLHGNGTDTLVWQRRFAAGNTTFTFSWQTTTNGLQAGEVRPVTSGTTVNFQSGGTPGSLTLPGTAVTGVPIIALSPAALSAQPGGAARYDVRLINPTAAQETYSLAVGGLPDSWTADLPGSVTIAANTTTDVTLTLHPDPGASAGPQAFTVTASDSNNGAQGTAAGTLNVAGAAIPAADTVARGVLVALTPAQASAGQGTSAVYTVRVTNTGSEDDSFALAVTGLPQGITASLAETAADVPPGTGNFRDVTLTLSSSTGAPLGAAPFQVTATSEREAAVTGSAAGTLTVLGTGVSVSLNPSSGAPGSGFAVRVTNTGQVQDTFDLGLAGPAALVATLGTTKVRLAPGASQVVPISTAAAPFAVQGDLSLAAMATSETNTAVRGQDTAALAVAPSVGMTAQLQPASETLTGPGPATFTLVINNTGNTEDAYQATITGTNGPVTASLIGLDGLPAQTVPLIRVPGLSTAALVLQVNLSALGQGTINVRVTSLNNSNIAADATATVSAQSPTTVTPTVTKLTASPNPDPFGTAVTLTAAVTPQPIRTAGVQAEAAAPAPTGTVTFTVDGKPQPPVTLNAAGAVLPLSGLAVGAHTVSAAYSGDRNYAPSASAPLTINVTALPPPPPPATGDGPRVTGLERFGYHALPTTLVLQFSGPLDPARAQDAANYLVTGPGGINIGFASAVYDPAAHTVTLHPRQRLNIHHVYTLTARGTGAGALADPQGRLLDGAGTGKPGSDYVTQVTWHNLVFGAPRPAPASLLRFHSVARHAVAPSVVHPSSHAARVTPRAAHLR